jgi:serine/threonine-protein kinase
MTLSSAIDVGVRPGDVLAGKYRVERVLGAGGMGVVVAAYHVKLEEKVALKFLRPEALVNAEAMMRFDREARAAAKIKSEHVARVIDVGSLPSGAPYMVMEYLEGSDLSAWLRQYGPLPIGQAIEFVLQACVAVADAHALGIVHRDLKPSNLFCVRRSDGELMIKVLDFGISKLLDDGARGIAATKTSAMMGSPLYMSPEQMRSARDVDARTDIWSTGVVLFELLAGRTPFFSDSVTELAIQVATERDPDVCALRRDVPAELGAVIARCLAKEPDERYQNMAELSVALLPFAPSTAKVFVDRVAGIIQSAGLDRPSLESSSAPPGMSATATFPNTVPPVGRSTAGTARGKAGALGAIVGVLSVAAGVAAFVVWSHASGPVAPRGGAGAAATGDPSASAGSVTPTTGAKSDVSAEDAPSASSQSAEASTASTPVPGPEARADAAPSPMVPASSSRSEKTPPAATASARSADVRPPPAAAPPPKPNCDPPYYYDPRGNRVFKSECPL